MKKIPLAISLLLLTICGCKKDKNTNGANLEVTITCQCTFDLVLTQRQNTTLQTFTIANQSGISNRYDVSNLVGSSKDLVEIKVTNASVPPVAVNVEYNGASILSDSSLQDNGRDWKVYIP